MHNLQDALDGVKVTAQRPLPDAELHPVEPTALDLPYRLPWLAPHLGQRRHHGLVRSGPPAEAELLGDHVITGPGLAETQRFDRP